MKKAVIPLFAALFLSAAAARAAHVDMKEPKRALGREDDVRVDAQLNDDAVGPGSPIGLVYQIENLSPKAIAFADKVTSADYDQDSLTIVISIGAEVPNGQSVPHLVVIQPGETKTFSAGTSVHVPTPSIRTPWIAVPRYVQVRVNVLRDVTPFRDVLAQQAKTAAAAVPVTNAVFDRWLDANTSIELNALPVVWQAKSQNQMSAERRTPSAAVPAPGRPSSPGGTW